MSDLSNLLSVGEVAGRLALSRQAVRNLCHRGELPYLELGKSWRIDASDLEAYVHTKRDEALQRARDARQGVFR